MTKTKTCENCTKPINIPAFALNKRFCSDSCRNHWHNSRAKRAKELLTAAEAKEGKDQL